MAVSVGAIVAVSVGSGGGVGVNAAAVNVNCASTVLAAEVRTAATSGVGAAGVAAPLQAASQRDATREITMFFLFICVTFAGSAERGYMEKIS